MDKGMVVFADWFDQNLRANRQMETEKLLSLLRSETPNFFEIASCNSLSNPALDLVPVVGLDPLSPCLRL
jgi:hypothetical protein